MKTHITTTFAVLIALSLVIPAGLIQAQTNLFSGVGGAGVAGLGQDPTQGAQWQGGNCSNEQSQLVQLQDSFNQKQNNVLTMKQQITQLYNQISQLQKDGIGPFMLRVSPVNPTAGRSFSVSATVASTSTKSYTLELIKDGQIVTTFTTNEPISALNRPATVTRDYVMPSSTQPGGYTLRMKDSANQNTKSVIDLQVL